jgi:hypothetical protein
MKTTKARVLNMEEKRKLEKIIFQDIDKAINTYKANNSEKRVNLLADVIKGKEAQELLARFIATQKEEEEVNQAIRNLGLSTVLSGDYTDKNRKTILIAYNGYNSKSTKHTKALDDKEQENITKLEAMKRNYTLKLFAGGDEALNIFESLAKEIQALTK